MANVIKQYRFFDKTSNKNYNIEKVDDLVKGTFLEGSTPIIQLGIQALPGTRFYLNGRSEPIIIGENGIFELELDGVTEIHKIRFDCASLDSICKDRDGGLLIDTIYIDNGGNINGE